MRIYIAGPYSKGDVVQNVAMALRVAERVWCMGDIPYVPHLTMFWHFAHPHAYEEWLAYDMEWLKQCQAVIRIEGESSGADREVMAALAMGMPVMTVSTYFAGKVAEQLKMGVTRGDV